MFTVGYGTMAYSLIKERFASTHAGAEPMPVAALVDGGFGALREEVVAETANGM
jgi:hypothetical protein